MTDGFHWCEVILFKALHELLICSFSIITIKARLHVSTVTKPWLIYFWPSAQNVHHIWWGKTNGQWEVTVCSSDAGVNYEVRLYHRKSIQCVYWLHEYSLDKWAYEPKTHIFIWLVYISTEKQLQLKHMHTYLLNVYHLKSWDFKSGVRYGVQDLPSQTCRHIKAVHIYELLWFELHRLTRKVFSESINSSTRS